jgi:hypothetical protein
MPRPRHPLPYNEENAFVNLYSQCSDDITTRARCPRRRTAAAAAGGQTRAQSVPYTHTHIYSELKNTRSVLSLHDTHVIIIGTTRWVIICEVSCVLVPSTPKIGPGGRTEVARFTIPTYKRARTHSDHLHRLYSRISTSASVRPPAGNMCFRTLCMHIQLCYYTCLHPLAEQLIVSSNTVSLNVRELDGRR